MEPTVRSPRIESALASEAALISVMISTITPWIWFDLVSRKVKGTPVGVEPTFRTCCAGAGRLAGSDRGRATAVACRRVRPNAASGNNRLEFHLEAWRGGPRRYRRLQFSCDARVHVQPAGRCVPGWCRSPCRPARAGQRTLSDPSRPARRRRDRLSRSAVDVHGPRGPRFELDHQTTRRLHGQTAGRDTVVNGAAGALHRDRQLAPHRNDAARHLCGK